MGKIKEWFKKLRQKENIVTKMTEDDKNDNLLLKAMRARTQANCYTSTYSNDDLEFTVSLFQLYKGCDWYEFITTGDYRITYHEVACQEIESIKIENLSEYTYFNGSHFGLDFDGKECVCTVEHIIRDSTADKIFFKLHISEKK